ncbi:MAG: hypothetical protein Q7R96_03530 [Nanoarchaeota archaeon]|nr:hypothetical protein [Nanoarchaeota archaeon]
MAVKNTCPYHGSKFQRDCEDCITAIEDNLIDSSDPAVSARGLRAREERQKKEAFQRASAGIAAEARERKRQAEAAREEEEALKKYEELRAADAERERKRQRLEQQADLDEKLAAAQEADAYKKAAFWKKPFLSAGKRFREHIREPTAEMIEAWKREHPGTTKTAADIAELLRGGRDVLVGGREPPGGTGGAGDSGPPSGGGTGGSGGAGGSWDPRKRGGLVGMIGSFFNWLTDDKKKGFKKILIAVILLAIILGILWKMGWIGGGTEEKGKAAFEDALKSARGNAITPTGNSAADLFQQLPGLLHLDGAKAAITALKYGLGVPTDGFAGDIFDGFFYLLLIGLAGFSIVKGHTTRVIMFIVGIQLCSMILPSFGTGGVYLFWIITFIYASFIGNFNYTSVRAWIAFIAAYFAINYCITALDFIREPLIQAKFVPSPVLSIALALIIAVFFGGTKDSSAFGAKFAEEWAKNINRWMQKPGFWIAIAIIIVLIFSYVKYHDQLFGKEDETGKPQTGFIHFMKRLFTEQSELAKESVGFGTPTTKEKEIKSGIIFDKIYSPYPFYYATPEGLPLMNIVVEAVNVIVDTFKTPSTIEFQCKYKKQTYPFLGIGLGDYNTIPAEIIGKKENPLTIIPKETDTDSKRLFNIRCSFNDTTPDFRVRFESEMQKKADAIDILKKKEDITQRIAALQKELDESISSYGSITEEQFKNEEILYTTYAQQKQRARELQEKIKKETTNSPANKSYTSELRELNKLIIAYEEAHESEKSFSTVKEAYDDQKRTKAAIASYIRERDGLTATSDNEEEAQQEITLVGTYKDFKTLTCLNIYTVNENMYDGIQPKTEASCLQGCGLAVLSMETPSQPWIFPTEQESRYTNTYPLIVQLYKHTGGGGNMLNLTSIKLRYDQQFFEIPADTTFIKGDIIGKEHPIIKNLNNKFAQREHGEVVSITEKDKTFYYGITLKKASNPQGKLQASKVCVEATYDYQFSTTHYIEYTKKNDAINTATPPGEPPK